MNRFLPNFSELLSVDDRVYASSLKSLWDWWLNLDQAFGDDFLPNGPVLLELFANEVGVLAGREELLWVINEFFPGVNVSFDFRDGERFGAGAKIAEIKGETSQIRRLERTMLNWLGRLSGIATKTADLALGVKNISLAATRKTLWSIFDKKAVVVGGGLSHRLTLNQALMIKDNDWDWFRDYMDKFGYDWLIGRDWAFVEIEVENTDQLEFFAEFADKYIDSKMELPPLGLMLDNWKSEDLKSVLVDIPKIAFVEVSGGVTAENLSDFDLPGVDFVSMGALTKHSYAIDFSLELAKK